MDTFETATLIWVCLTQALTVLLAAGFIVGVMLHERSEGYVGAHRPDRGMVSTWQSRGRVFQGYETRIDVDDQAERLAAVEATALAIETRAEVWNRELLSGPLFDLPPAGPDVPERYEPSAGDLAYLELTDGSLARSAVEPMRPHPARVDTSELTIIDLDVESGSEVERELAWGGVT
jgi:hypothetical protein